MYNHNEQFFDSITIATTILQLLTIMITSQDSTNNDLMKELQRQDRDYLERIIKQNDEIIAKLTEKVE